MSEHEPQAEAPPEYVTLLGKAADDAIDLALLRRGIDEARVDIARQAAYLFAQGLYPSQYFEQLQRLDALRKAVCKAMADGVTKAAVEAETKAQESGGPRILGG